MTAGDWQWLAPLSGAAVGAVLVAALLMRRARRRFVAFSAVEWLVAAGLGPSPARWVPIGLVAVALALVGLALAEPVLPEARTEIRSRGLDIVLVLDLSSSMQELMGMGASGRVVSSAGRTGPLRMPTRLDTTKAALATFISRRRDDRIGLVVFSDRAYVVSPLTFDYEPLGRFVAAVDENTLRGEGMTAIGDGIGLAHALLARQSTGAARNKVIVVFTDGEHNIGRDPLDALDEAAAAGVRVHLVGVDLEPEVRRRPAVARLIRAVRRHGGQFFRADSAGALEAASAALDDLEQGTLVQHVSVRNVPVYDRFVEAAVGLLVLAFVLRAVPLLAEFT
jgi:Ca-activated chloride channel family protein